MVIRVLAAPVGILGTEASVMIMVSKKVDMGRTLGSGSSAGRDWRPKTNQVIRAGRGRNRCDSW